MYHQKILEQFDKLEASIYNRYKNFHNPRLTEKERKNLSWNLEKKLLNFYKEFDEYIRENAIFQYDLSGMLVAIYLQADDACDDLEIKKSGLSQCINGNLKSYKGYLWTKGVGGLKG